MIYIKKEYRLARDMESGAVLLGRHARMTNDGGKLSEIDCFTLFEGKDIKKYARDTKTEFTKVLQQFSEFAMTDGGKILYIYTG